MQLLWPSMELHLQIFMSLCTRCKESTSSRCLRNCIVSARSVIVVGTAMDCPSVRWTYRKVPKWKKALFFGEKHLKSCYVGQASERTFFAHETPSNAFGMPRAGPSMSFRSLSKAVLPFSGLHLRRSRRRQRDTGVGKTVAYFYNERSKE